MTASRFLSSTVPAAPSGLPASGLHRGAVRVRTRGVALVLSLAAALVVPLSGCATQNADSSASASASVDGSLAVSRGVAPVNEERESYRLFSGRGPVEEAVFEGPAGTGSYSYIEFERRGEPTTPMRVSLRDEAGTSVEFPAGESGELGGVWVRNTAEAPSPSASASAGASSDVSLSATRVTASTSNLADDAQWVVSVRSMGVDSSGELTAPEGLALVSQTLSSGDIVQQGTRGFVDDTTNRSRSRLCLPAVVFSWMIWGWVRRVNRRCCAVWWLRMHRPAGPSRRWAPARSEGRLRNPEISRATSDELSILRPRHNRNSVSRGPLSTKILQRVIELSKKISDQRVKDRDTLPGYADEPPRYQ